MGIRRVLPYIIAPPVEVDTAFRYLQGKEYDDEAEDDACVEPRSKQVIVPHPPTEMEASHEPLEEATNKDPRSVVHAIDGWNAVGCSQCDRDVDVAPA